MENSIKVSVITPSYNQGQFIGETIDSVLSQTYKNIQYIIVDGGSNDETMDVVAKYRDKIDIVIHERDNGQSDAIGKGFKLATGELVGWINSDDILYPDCVERIVETHLNNPDGSIYYGSLLDILDADTKRVGSKRYSIPNSQHLLNVDFDVVQPGSFYSNAALKKIDYLDESIHYCMDLDLWIRLLKEGPIYSYDDHPIATIRKWEGTKTSTGANKFLSEIKKTITKHGASATSRNIRKIYFDMFKNNIKTLLNSK